MSSKSRKIDDSDLILVTGASGYIACHIIKQLLERGYRVRGTVRSLKNESKVAPLRRLVPSPKYPLDLVEADLEKEDGWLQAVQDCTYVVHTASPFPLVQPKNEQELIRPAVNGTMFVLKACAAQPGSKVKRVVLTVGDFVQHYIYLQFEYIYISNKFLRVHLRLFRVVTLKMEDFTLTPIGLKSIKNLRLISKAKL
jgi:hypothetical protein